MGWSGERVAEATVAPIINKTAAPVIVRRANLFDIPAFIALGRRIYADSAYSFLDFDQIKAENLLRHYLNAPATHCVFVAEDDGLLIGGLCGYVTEYFFSREKFASDQTFFVAPEWRGFIALKLVAAFCDWAEVHGARQVNLGISSGLQTERSGALLERMGFACVGGNYKMRLS